MPPKDGRFYRCCNEFAPAWVDLRWVESKGEWRNRAGRKCLLIREAEWTLAPGQEPDDGETVEVRYAIAIDRDGFSSVAGGTGLTDDDMRDLAIDSSDLDRRSLEVRFGTTPVPLPKPLEVEGEVEA